jgi:hypothetical protein
LWAFKLKFDISTSQTPTQVHKKNWRLERSNCVGGFGTVSDVGYGISYIPYGEHLVFFSVHCKKSCPTTDSLQFREALDDAFKDMKNLFVT